MWEFSWRKQQRSRVAAARVPFSEVRAAAPDHLSRLLSDDPGQAIAWVSAAARYGLVEAQLVLGQMLLDGNGTSRDPRAAFQWFSAAANAGNADAINMVGRCHEGGWGVKQDFRKAIQFYRKAADHGLDWGQYNLANMLLRGRGVIRDRREALTWYLRAARQGHAKSMNLVGRFFEEGWDVPVDRQTARCWYRRSAERGDFRGQYNLATIMADEQQLAQAVELYRAAVASGSDDFLRSVYPLLLRSTEPAFREIGARAMAHIATHERRRYPTRSSAAAGPRNLTASAAE
jgi:uncharacterized protein